MYSKNLISNNVISHFPHIHIHIHGHFSHSQLYLKFISNLNLNNQIIIIIKDYLINYVSLIFIAIVFCHLSLFNFFTFFKEGMHTVLSISSRFCCTR